MRRPRVVTATALISGGSAAPQDSCAAMTAVDTSRWPLGTEELVTWTEGRALKEHSAVQWAVRALADGFDTPNVRELAGLDLGGDRLPLEVREIADGGLLVVSLG